MINRSSPYYLLAAICTLLFFASCEKTDPSENAGRLRIKLTDATDVSIKELYLDVREIAIYATDTLGQDGEWVKLEYSGGEYNLLTLLNGKKIQLVDQYFPADKTIHRVKLVLGNNNRILTFTIDEIPLQLPPQFINEVVIDVIEPIRMEPHIISSIVLDVNAALSVREVDGNYFLYPSARAFSETYGSSLRGYLSPQELRSIWFIGITKEETTLMSLPEPDGMFLFPGLEEGIWEVYLATLPDAIFADTTFTWNIDTTGIVDIIPKPLRLPTRASIPD